MAVFMYHVANRTDRTRLWNALDDKSLQEGHVVERMPGSSDFPHSYVVDTAGVSIGYDIEARGIEIYGIEEEMERTKSALEEMARIKLIEGRAQR